MVSLQELDEVVRYITSRGSELVVLYCVSQYPCPPELFNLATIERLIEQYPSVTVGFSDHSITHEAVEGALKLGAKVIEKHFSFDRALWGSDHKASLTPEEFKEMVTLARAGQYHDSDHSLFYGLKEKELEGAENQFRPYFNKALVAGLDIEKGTVITEDMVYAMRPVQLIDGLPSNTLHEVIGKKSKRSIKKMDPLTRESFE